MERYNGGGDAGYSKEVFCKNILEAIILGEIGFISLK